jgi:serine/threonine protein kinase
VVEVARQEPPKVRFGSYLLHDRIGVGGMAEIFLATTPSPHGVDRELVIKRILPALSHDEQFVKMFVEEARLCVNLRHPNIVQVYDLGAVDHQYFIAMEYVHGRDLLKTLAACARRRIGFPTDLALYIVMEVLKGLDYAHNLRGQDGKPLGIIHRDVSPSNVLLSFDGRVKLADFGIAKATTRERTATGVLKGKFGYMAPEQVIGRPMDHRADVFAVGILLYELLTGHRLFAARNDIAVIERVRDALIEPPPRHYNPDLSQELEAMVLRALAREPRDRFQSTFELHEALYGYTFKRGVVVTARTLSRFLHDLFLNESTEEHYGASAAKNRADAVRAFPSLAPASPSAPAGPNAPAGLGASAIAAPSVSAQGARAQVAGAARSLPPFAAPDPRLLAAAEALDPRLQESSQVIGLDQFTEESTENPDFDDDVRTASSLEGKMLPFPGAEQAKRSFGAAIAYAADPDPDTESSLDHGPEEATALARIPVAGLDDPAERRSLEPARAARRVELQPVGVPPALEARALRRRAEEASETELDLEDDADDAGTESLSLRGRDSIITRPIQDAEAIESSISPTPYGGVPLASSADATRRAEPDVEPTIDRTQGSLVTSLVDDVRRALDAHPITVEALEAQAEVDEAEAPSVVVQGPRRGGSAMAVADVVEAPEGAAEATDLLGSSATLDIEAMRAELAADGTVPTPVDDERSAGTTANHEVTDLEELSEFIELVEDGTGQSGVVLALGSGALNEHEREAGLTSPSMDAPDVRAWDAEIVDAPGDGTLSGQDPSLVPAEAVSGVQAGCDEPSMLRAENLLDETDRALLDDSTRHDEVDVPSMVVREWAALVEAASRPDARSAAARGARARVGSTTAPRVASAVAARGASPERAASNEPTSDREIPARAVAAPSTPGLRLESQVTGPGPTALRPRALQAHTDFEEPTHGIDAPTARGLAAPGEDMRLGPEEDATNATDDLSLAAPPPSDPTPEVEPLPEAGARGTPLPSARPRRSSVARVAPTPERRGPSLAARRVPARGALSVVNPPHEETRYGALANVADEDPDEVSNGHTRMGELASGGMVDLAPRAPSPRMSSGVRDALSEAAAAEAEIRAIRATSEVGPIDERTAYGELVRARSALGLLDAPLVDDVPRPSESRESKRLVKPRFESKGLVLFGDEESSNVMPPRPSRSRLDDDGASGLFGALNVLERNADDLDDADLRSFDPGEEASFETTASHESAFSPNAIEESDPRVAQGIVAPSVAAALAKASPSRLDFADPAEVPSGLIVSVEARGDDDAPLDEPTDSQKELSPEAQRARVMVASPRSGSVSADSESGELPDILEERVAGTSANRAPTYRAPSRQVRGGSGFVEETPQSTSFGHSRDRDAAGVLEDDLRSVLNPQRADSSSGDHGVYGRDGSGLVGEEFDFGLDGPRSGPSPAARRAKPSAEPARGRPSESPRGRASEAPPRGKQFAGEADASEESGPSLAERRLRAAVERSRPVKEKQRTGEIRIDAHLAGAQPATATGFYMPSSPPPQAQPPTADVRIPVRASQPATPAGVTPMSPSISAGQSTPSAATLAPWLTTRRAMMILAAALTLVGATFLTLALTRTRNAKPIAPVASRPSAPRPPSSAPTNDVSPAPPTNVASPAPPAGTGATPSSATAPSSSDASKTNVAPTDAPRGAAPTDEATRAEARIAAEERRIAERREREAAERREREVADRRAREAADRRAAERKTETPRAEPPRATEAKATPPRASEPRAREPKAAPGVKIPPNMGALKLECSAPATVKIQGEGDHTAVTKKTFLLVPKAYRVTIERADGSTASTFTRVVAGTTVTIACDH